jgi:hypothetical protein
MRAGTARADVHATSPLLVIVEVGAGGGCDAGDVRQAVRAELVGAAIAAPSEPRASEATRALLVGVERNHVAMLLHRNAAPSLARTIPVPAERGARLRAIAWLARNMVRDQVSDVVEAPPPPLETTTRPVLPADFPAIEPPRLRETAEAASSDSPDAPMVVTTESPPGAAASSAWLITAAGGLSSLPAEMLYSQRYVAPPDVGPSVGVGEMAFGGGSTWMLEAQRLTNSGRLMGVALDARSRSRDRFGGAAFIGSRWARGQSALETTIGAGIEAATTTVLNTTITDSSTSGISSVTEVQYAMRPAFYLRGGIAGFVDVSDSLAIMARVGAHLSMLGDHTDANWLIGMRMKLP